MWQGSDGRCGRGNRAKQQAQLSVGVVLIAVGVVLVAQQVRAKQCSGS
jgi:hypothetical protein